MSEPVSDAKETASARIVLHYDPATGAFRWIFHGEFPIQPLVGALEVLKAQLVNRLLHDLAQTQQQEARKRVLLAGHGNNVPPRRP